MMKKRISILAIILIALGVLNAAAINKKIDFGGTWKMDSSKCEPHDEQGLKAGVGTMKVIQLDDKLVLLKYVNDNSGNRIALPDTITFDGKERKGKIQSGQVLSRAITRDWTADGKAMVLDMKFSMETESGEPVEFSAKETWELGTDGKTLTILNEMIMGEEVKTTKLVYNRE